MINRTNYESFIVDFTEGKLSGQLRAEIELFLEANPDVRAEIELFLESKLQDFAVTYPGKGGLKQIPFEKTDIHSEYFQQQCIDFVEGLMTKTEKALFLEMVHADTLKKKELELFQKTVLIPQNVTYNEKLLLKKHERNQVINHENFELYCIAYLEEWLDDETATTFNQYILNHPEKQGVLNQYSQFRLKPDYSITYPNKRHLKHFLFLNKNTKKYLAYASSAAAILVFSAMLYYSSQYGNKLQLTGSLITNSKNAVSNNSREAAPVTVQAAANSLEQKESNSIALFKNNTKVTTGVLKNDLQPQQKNVLHPIDPIRVSMLECPPCKQFFLESKEIKVNSTKDMELFTEQNNHDSQVDETDKKVGINSKIKELASKGISEISKLTNSEIVVKKEEKQKTRIAFNSKYFAFSTTVKSKQSNF